MTERKYINKKGGEAILMKIGVQELLLIFIVALIVLGPDKLPMYAQKFGEALKEFRKFSSDATKDIRESIVEPLEEAQRPLREALEPITELEKDVRNDVKGIKKSLEDIGKPAKPVKAAEGESVDTRTAEGDMEIKDVKEQPLDIALSKEAAIEQAVNTEVSRENTVKQDFDAEISDMEISQKEAEEQISDLELALKSKQPEDTNLLVQETSEPIGLSDVLEAT